jgi:transposase
LVVAKQTDSAITGGRYTEKLSWIETGDRFTRRLKAWVKALVQILPIKHVSQLTGLNWQTIRNIDHRRLKALHGSFNADGVTRRLVVDEFALHKGHQYATVVMYEQRLRVLWVGEGRSRATLKPFFDLLGEEGCRRIEAVAMDMN